MQLTHIGVKMKIKVIKNKDILDYETWPIWKCEPSKFDWEYLEEEHCYVIEGKVKVIGNVNTVNITKGDYVIFPKGLKCNWEVTKSIKKYYYFK